MEEISQAQDGVLKPNVEELTVHLRKMCQTIADYKVRLGRGLLSMGCMTILVTTLLLYYYFVVSLGSCCLHHSIKIPVHLKTWQTKQ